MSTPAALSLVTDTLKAALEAAELTVSTKPPDVAAKDPTPGSVNLFLYQTAVDSAWRNQDIPRPAGCGQPGRPLLPLNLYYLITAYGSDDGDQTAHESLGDAMLALHDRPIIPVKEGDHGWRQPDPIRVTPQPLTLDEMSKLWSAFQTAYRLSAAYEVGPVLIESTFADAAPLPVRRLGEADRGWDATTQFPPVVERIELPNPTRPGLLDGDEFTVVGRDLLGPGELSIGLDPVNRNLSTTAAIARPTVVSRSPNRIRCTISENPAGVYLVSVRHSTRNAGSAPRVTSSNAVPIAVLPIVFPPASPLQITAVTISGQPKYRVILDCEPVPLPGQRGEILVGGQAFPATVARAGAASEFTWPQQPIVPRPGEKLYVRLRIDGVESLIPGAPYDEAYVAELPGTP